MPEYRLPKQDYDEASEGSTQSPLRAALYELDRITGDLDKTATALGDRLSPLRVDRPSPVDTEVDSARAHSELVMVIVDVVDRLRRTEHRLETLHAELEV